MSVKLALSRFFSCFFSKIKVYFVISSILVDFTARGVPRSLGRVRWAMEALKAIGSIYTKRIVNILIINWREVRIRKFTVEVPCELQKSFGAHS